MKYGTITIQLNIELPASEKAADTPEGQDWLETNLDSQIQAIINYAKTRISLGEHSGVVASGVWHWGRP